MRKNVLWNKRVILYNILVHRLEHHNKVREIEEQELWDFHQIHVVQFLTQVSGCYSYHIDIKSHFEVFIFWFDFFAQKCKLDVTELEVEEVLGEIKIDSQQKDLYPFKYLSYNIDENRGSSCNCLHLLSLQVACSQIVGISSCQQRDLEEVLKDNV